MTDLTDFVVLGVDTHRDTHYAVLVDGGGGELAGRRFPATASGYADLFGWAGGHGPVRRAGVEGTGSYGAGLARYLLACGVEVVEVTSTDRAQRRLRGKTDHLDALHAARAALSGQADVPAKDTTGRVEEIRLLHIERRQLVKQQTETMNLIHSIVVSAPDTIRARLAGKGVRLARACAQLRARAEDGPTGPTVIKVLQRRAHTWLENHKIAAALLREIEQLVARVNPALLAEHGVGPDSAATLLISVGDNPERVGTSAGFAQLTGVAPIPVSSGNTSRYRLSRGGDRQANAALHRIIIVRLKSDPETRAYLARCTARGKTKKDAIRLLKRYLARRLYPILIGQPQPPQQTLAAAGGPSPRIDDLHLTQGTDGPSSIQAASVVAREESTWSTRSAASMNDVDADERRHTIGRRGGALPSAS